MTKKSIGLNDLQERKFESLVLDEPWRDHLGPDLVKRFDMCVTGDSGHGKTTYVLQLMKELCQHGRGYYNSVEQGFSATLQTNIKLIDLSSIRGKIMFGDRLTYEELKAKLKNKYFRCNYLVIDSIDYMGLTFDQFQELKAIKPKTLSIILICWSNGTEKPKDTQAQAINYACDIKVHVKNFVAHARSRFGAIKPHMIYEAGFKASRKKKTGNGVMSLFENGGEL